MAGHYWVYQVRLALENGEFGWMEQAAVECQVPAGLMGANTWDMSQVMFLHPNT